MRGWRLASIEPMAKILVVEDERTTWKLLEYKLTQAGHDLFWAGDGLKALELAREKIPTLILLDLMIPSPDGIRVLKILKEDEKLKSIPVIILSAMSLDENIIEGLEIGAEDYLTKPFSPEELLLRIERILNQLQG